MHHELSHVILALRSTLGSKLSLVDGSSETFKKPRTADCKIRRTCYKQSTTCCTKGLGLSLFTGGSFNHTHAQRNKRGTRNTRCLPRVEYLLGKEKKQIGLQQYMNCSTTFVFVSLTHTGGGTEPATNGRIRQQLRCELRPAS